jgi:hypothetical protein
MCTDHGAELPSQIDVECSQIIIPVSTPPQDSVPLPPPTLHTQESEQPARDSPDFDFYNNCYSFSPLIYAWLLVAMIVGMKYTVLPYSPSDTSQLFSLLYLYFSVLAASALCRRTPASRRVQIIVRILCSSFYGLVVGNSTFFVGHTIVPVTLFLTCLSIVAFDEWKMWRAKGGSV